MTRTPTAQPPRKPGRPIDPDFEARIFAAAIEIYAQTGWVGFTLNAVTALSRTGKASLYRRWASKEDLLIDALLSLGANETPNTGSLRDDLVSGVQQELLEYLSPRGTVRLRAHLEAKEFPELFGAAMERYNKQRRNSGQHVLRAAMNRGELPTDTDVTQLLDAMQGMTVNRYLTTPRHKLPTLRRNSREFAESVVEFVLRAAGAESSGGHREVPP